MEGSTTAGTAAVSAAGEAVLGRERELAALTRFLVAPWPRVLLLEGPAGIGKSTLVDAAVRLAAGGGATPLVARPTLVERDLPHAALSSLLPDARVDPVLPAIAAPRRRALEIALRKTPATGDLDPAALGLAVLDVVRAIARPVPVLLVVDDLQWCDGPTASALAFALRRAGDSPVALLAGVRTGIASPAVDGISRALPDAMVDRVAVGPLSVGAIRRLVESRSGRSRARAVTARIAEAAGGNPLLALELARAIDATGRDPAPGEPLTIPSSAEPLIGERLGRLSGPALDAILTVALAGSATVARLRVAADEAVAGAGVQEAMSAGLLELDGEALRLSHPLVGAAAVGRATLERRRATHAHLAASTTDAEGRARHLAMAADGPDPDAAAACDAASHSAERRGAPEVAADLAELAVGLTDATDLPRIAARRCRAAALWVAVGDPVRARQHLDAALVAATTPEARVPVLLVGVELAHLVGGRPAAREAGWDRARRRRWRPDPSRPGSCGDPGLGRRGHPRRTPARGGGPGIAGRSRGRGA